MFRNSRAAKGTRWENCYRGDTRATTPPRAGRFRRRAWRAGRSHSAQRIFRESGQSNERKSRYFIVTSSSSPRIYSGVSDFRKARYGTKYTVMAKSQKAALESLRKHCEKTCIPYVNNMEDYNYFANGRGSFVTYAEGEVLETEVR